MLKPEMLNRLSMGRGTSIALLAVVLALFGDWLADPAVTPLKVARIEGDLRYLKRSDLELAVEKATRGGFFTVDVQAVKDAAESLPWVAKASVRRVWPDAIHIWVVEQNPLARWGKASLINPEGDVFTPESKHIPEGLPWFNGPDKSGKEVVERYRMARNQLQSVGLTIEQLSLSDRRAWSLTTRDGMVLKLGVERFSSRIKRFTEVYQRLRQSNRHKMNEVDMRYDNGLAVKWADTTRRDNKGSAS